MSKVRIEHRRAYALAERIVEILRPGCERIEIAGSLRRRRATVGDIEIVAIAKQALDLFGTPMEGTGLDPILAELVSSRRIHPRAVGPKNKRYDIVRAGEAGCEGLQLDLWLCAPSTWGVLFAIRTGSPEFAKLAVTQQTQGGWLDNSMRVKAGRLWQAGRGQLPNDGKPIDAEDLLIDGKYWYRAVPTPEEADFLKHAGGYIEPTERDAAAQGLVTRSKAS